MDYDFGYRIKALVEKGSDRSGWVFMLLGRKLKALHLRLYAVLHIYRSVSIGAMVVGEVRYIQL